MAFARLFDNRSFGRREFETILVRQVAGQVFIDFKYIFDDVMITNSAKVNRRIISVLRDVQKLFKCIKIPLALCRHNSISPFPCSHARSPIVFSHLIRQLPYLSLLYYTLLYYTTLDHTVSHRTLLDNYYCHCYSNLHNH